MRFHFADARRHRQAVKSLARALRGLGIDTGHTACLDIAARMYGYGDRHELDACLGKGPPSAWDEDEAPGIVAARRERQEAALAAAGVPDGARAGVLDTVRPTARKPAPARGLPPAPRPAPRRPDPGGGISAMLDAWSTAADGPPEERFARLVRRAYDGGYESLEVGVSDGCESVTATGFRRMEYLHETPEADGLLGWLAGRVPGPPVTVPHPSGAIPVTFTMAVTSWGRQYLACRLGRHRARPVPTLEQMGLEGGDDWERALFDRVGLTVLAVPGDDGPLTDLIEYRAAARGYPVARRRTDADSLGHYAARAQSCPAPCPRTSAPIEIALMSSGYGLDATLPEDVIRAAIASGTSAVMVTDWKSAADWVRAMLMRGVPVDDVRSMLVATGSWRPAGDGGEGRVEVLPPPIPRVRQGQPRR